MYTQDVSRGAVREDCNVDRDMTLEHPRERTLLLGCWCAEVLYGR